MTFLDKVLRDWRIKKVIPFIKPNDSILDIGAFDDTFFKALTNVPIDFSIGLDPLLEKTSTSENYKLIQGKFPDDLPHDIKFNCITMLAVLEHIPNKQQQHLSRACYDLLKNQGRVIITVPSPFVDYILWVLTKLKLVDGMSLDEHYGFKAKNTPLLFNPKQFKLLKHQVFQLGLNNVFVFEKIG